MTVDQIYPNRWISGWEACRENVLNFAKWNIHQVINVSCEDIDGKWKKLYKTLGIRYIWYKTYELARVDIVKRGRQVAAHLREYDALGKGTLLHCWAGWNRSVCCLVVDRMLEGLETCEEILLHIRKIRPVVDPMPEFWKRIQRFQQKLDENRLLGDCSLYLVSNFPKNYFPVMPEPSPSEQVQQQQPQTIIIANNSAQPKPILCKRGSTPATFNFAEITSQLKPEKFIKQNGE